MAAKNYILRSVYLEPALDAFLRHQAFTQNISKNDLIRRYVALGASVELGEDVLGLMKAHPRSDVRKITADIKNAAYGANLAPLRITPTGSAVVRTSAGGTVLITNPGEAEMLASAPATPVIEGPALPAKRAATSKVAVKKVATNKATKKVTVAAKAVRAAPIAKPGSQTSARKPASKAPKHKAQARPAAKKTSRKTAKKSA